MLTTGLTAFHPDEYVQRWLSHDEMIEQGSGGHKLANKEKQTQHNRHDTNDGKRAHRKIKVYKETKAASSSRSSSVSENESCANHQRETTRPSQARRESRDRSKQRRMHKDSTLAVQHYADEGPRSPRLEQWRPSVERHSVDSRLHSPPVSTTSSLSNQQRGDITKEGIVSPTKKYARRLRHKTRDDKYEFKGDKKIKKDSNSRREQKVTRKRRPRKVTAAALQNDFKAPNVDSERLTLRRSTGPGFLSKGKSSAMVAHRDIPDLTFSEMTFLSKRRKIDEARYRREDIDHSPQKPTKKHVSQEITEYFSQAGPDETEGKAVKTVPTRNTPERRTKPTAAFVLSGGSPARQPYPQTLPKRSDDREQAGVWKSHDAAAGVLQFYPPPSQQRRSHHSDDQSSFVSWSTSPPRKVASGVHDRPSASRSGAVPGKNGEGVRHSKQTDKIPAQLNNDEDLYEFTRRALMGKELELWRHVPKGAPNRTKMSLEDLKQLAQQTKNQVDVLGAYEHHDYRHPEPRLNKHLLEETFMQSVNQQNALSDTNLRKADNQALPTHTTNDNFNNIRQSINPEYSTSWNLIQDSKLQPSSIHEDTKRYYDDSRSRVLHPKLSFDSRNVPEFPRLAPLEPEMLVTKRNIRYTEDTPQIPHVRHAYEHGSAQRQTLARVQPQESAAANEDGPVSRSAICTSNEHAAEIPFLQQSHVLLNNSSRSSICASPPLDRFDLELLDMQSPLLDKVSMSGKHTSLSDPMMVDVSANPVWRPANNLTNYHNYSKHTSRDNTNNETGHHARTKRWAISPDMQPFSRDNMPFLLG